MITSHGQNDSSSNHTPDLTTRVILGLVCTLPVTRWIGSSSLIVGWQLKTLDYKIIFFVMAHDLKVLLNVKKVIMRDKNYFKMMHFFNKFRVYNVTS